MSDQPLFSQGEPLDDHRLQGLVALVTGAGLGARGGIGAGLARRLAQAKATVAVNDLTMDAAMATVDELRQLGVASEAFVGDVGRPGDASRLVAQVQARFGSLDILVNNAGIRGRNTVDHITDEEWEHIVDVNLSAPFFTSRAALPQMRRRGFGRIINVSSLAGVLATAVSGAAYTATKTGLLGLTRHVAIEAAADGITVNAIMPGYTHVPFMDANFSAEALAAIAQTIPALKLGSIACLGAIAAFLASPAAGYITGTAVMADGGLSLIPGDYSAVRATRAASAINEATT